MIFLHNRYDSFHGLGTGGKSYHISNEVEFWTSPLPSLTEDEFLTSYRTSLQAEKFSAASSSDSLFKHCVYSALHFAKTDWKDLFTVEGVSENELKAKAITLVRLKLFFHEADKLKWKGEDEFMDFVSKPNFFDQNFLKFSVYLALSKGIEGTSLLSSQGFEFDNISLALEDFAQLNEIKRRLTVATNHLDSLMGSEANQAIIADFYNDYADGRQISTPQLKQMLLMKVPDDRIDFLKNIIK